MRGRLRPLLASAAVIGTLALAGCQTDGIDMAKAMKPIPPETVALMESKGMDKHAPILVRLFKEEAELEVWKQNRDGQYAILKTYPICRWSGELGPKVREGDRQAPEGFYTITPAQMNPRSQYYLSFNLGYPNAFDRSLGRTGSQLMVHGDCSSRGCYSMTDEQIAEIYALGRESFFGGQKTFQVQAYPFRMTALNMAKHRNSPHLAFWKMLKEGNDHFEVARAEPKVDVCERHYVFNAEERPGSGPLRFNPAGPCPAYQVAPELAAEVSAKTKRDELAFADFSRRGTPTVPIKVGQDGGMHPSFVAALNPQQVRDDSGNVRWMVDSPPIGTRIPTVAVASADAGTLPVSTGAAPSAP
ncbi:MAG: murein L,D-transpeptidase, partial [Rhizobiales bacterium]|nr:murein L,D-transpeptidase [Hyphomicrobiales bacterium]